MSTTRAYCRSRVFVPCIINGTVHDFVSRPHWYDMATRSHEHTMPRVAAYANVALCGTSYPSYYAQPYVAGRTLCNLMKLPV